MIICLVYYYFSHKLYPIYLFIKNYRSFYAISEYWVAVCVRFTLGIVLGINLSSIPVFIKNVTPVALLGKTVNKYIKNNLIIYIYYFRDLF